MRLSWTNSPHSAAHTEMGQPPETQVTPDLSHHHLEGEIVASLLCGVFYDLIKKLGRVKYGQKDGILFLFS